LIKENIFSYIPGKRVCILGGVHGNEIAGVEGIKIIVKDFSIDAGEV